MAKWFALPLCLLTGCSIDPIEAFQAGLDSPSEGERLATVESAVRIDDPRFISRLFDVFERDPLIREETASMLVVKGRRWWLEHPNAKRGTVHPNPVIAGAALLSARRDLEPDVRAKAVWIMAEIGDRRAKSQILAAYGGDSKAVQKEQELALQKLGFTAEAHELECLAYNRTTKGYATRRRAD